jgi:hypothetical protein
VFDFACVTICDALKELHFHVTILLLVRCGDRARVFHHERAKRRSPPKLPKCTDALRFPDEPCPHAPAAVP